MECVATVLKNSGNTKLRNFIEIKELLATFLTEDSSVEISSSQKRLMTFLAHLFLLHGNTLTSSGYCPLRNAGPNQDWEEIV